MDYRGFQRFILISGSVLIVISTILVYITTRSIPEAIGQLLFFLLLAGAVYYGRRGGIVTAIMASTIYATLHFPTILSLGISPVLPLILVRTAIYGITGPLGGELLAQIKRFMVEASQNQFVDPETKIFNKIYFAKLVQTELARFERYKTVSSVVMLNLDPEVVNLTRESPQEQGLRSVAEGLMSSIRLVDEVGRVEDQVFGVILPFTPADGAKIVARRLASVATDRLGYDNAVEYDIISLPDDKSKMEAMIKKYSSLDDS